MKSVTVTPDTGTGSDDDRLALSRKVASTDRMRLVPSKVVVSVGTGGRTVIE